MIYGLTDEQFGAILQEASRFENMTRMVVYGSGARGNDKPGSDVELAVWGLDTTDACSFKIRLNKYTGMPCTFDVVCFESVNDPALKQHIIDNGKTIYSIP
jgi:uncharacterized protein